MLFHPDDPELANKIKSRRNLALMGRTTFPIIMCVGMFATHKYEFGVFGMMFTFFGSMFWLWFTEYEVVKVMQTADRPFDDMPDHIIEAVRNQLVCLEEQEH